MNLEIATKDEVLAWFASHPREKELLIASDSEITWAEGGQYH